MFYKLMCSVPLQMPKRSKKKVIDFKVEKIVGKKNTDGRIEYFIKWEGYKDHQNTWEPRENCEDCEDLIAEFERNYKPTTVLQPSTSYSSSDSEPVVGSRV